MKIEREVAQELMYCSKGEQYNDYEVVEDGDWISEGKYEYKEIVFKFEGKYYRLSDSRSGSYFTDYHYESEDWDDEVEVETVVPKKVTTTKWVKV